jgi:CRP-like cAMP-binding protein
MKMTSKSKSEEELLESIDHRLKMLLKLQIEEKLDEYDTSKDKVKVLHKMGFDTSDMVEIVGTSRGSVRKILSRLRKQGEIDD